MPTKTLFIFLLLVRSASTSSQPTEFQKYPSNPIFFSGQEPLRKTGYRLSKPLIRDDGRIYTCSERNLFAFESNGSIAWTVNLNYTCNGDMAPVHGGSRKIYLVAENRVLKINPLNIGTSDSAAEIFFGPEPGEIIGLSISNTEGELYALYVRSPHFKWIQDFSSFDKIFTITPGNNGRLYVTVPLRALVLALDVSTGTVLWQRSIGPLSTTDCTPVVDSNGWISIGSLNGFLYSFSPTGALKKFPKAAALDSVVQVSPLLDCSGYALYISQTKMEGKISHTIGEYTYVSAMKPRKVVFTMLVPATGFIYWSESYPGQRVASSCSQAVPKSVSIYTGNEKAILLFLLFESAILLVLASLVRFCCIFWRKKKLQGQGLGKFLEKRHSLRLQKKTFDRTITDLQEEAAEKAVDSEVLEKLGDLVDSSSEKEADQIFYEDLESAVKAKAKAPIEVGSSSDDGNYEKDYQGSPSESASGSKGFINPLFMEHSFSEPKEVKLHDEREVMETVKNEIRLFDSLLLLRGRSVLLSHQSTLSLKNLSFSWRDFLV
ncbi:hypothetical protein F0562_005248 [Nyssa sinensis]|uniref:Protein GAMETE EXPRESSED 3 n=1 Tax=Nyssa sinensis TaxID=561372 RepID=A0A5J5AK32_9ASTE|nr:hypothetical protein F0562_005248 [Nyssa sinensis]